jgi:hypothetical protein
MNCPGPAGDLHRLMRQHPRDRSESAGRDCSNACSTSMGFAVHAGDPPSDSLQSSKIRQLRARSSNAWASLLQRVFEVDALRCPRCGSTLRPIAAIEDPTVASKSLGCLKLPARALPYAPAPADASHADDNFFDQWPAHDDLW